MYFSALGQPTIVLNSAKTVIDLLDRRGTIYSDRPLLHMADLCVSLQCITYCQSSSLVGPNGKVLLRSPSMAVNIMPCANPCRHIYRLR